MDAVLAEGRDLSSPRANYTWQRTAASVAAILLGIIFLVSGGWKLLSPFQTGQLLEEAKVPAGWGALGASALGTLEVFAAVLLFVPALRRWGGLLGSALILFFIAWVGFYYSALAGQECKCFPLIKRTVGPGFFAGDGVMLLLGLAAYFWSPAVRRTRTALASFLSIACMALVSFGAQAARAKNVQVPTPVVVDGKPSNLAQGKVFLFFYDPSCMHCDAAAKFMSKLDWNARVVSVPTVNPQWAAEFLRDTHLKAGTSLELAKLRKAFQFVDPPYGVALNDGSVQQTFGQAQFNAPSPGPDLKKLGFVK
jgi:uncharacterized membrane protein YphA (DoxX/SURF4 family)